MESARELTGFQGSGKTPCVVLVVDDWYVVKGGTVANQAANPELLEDGVHVEELIDVDCFTVIEGIHSLEELEDLL